MQIGGRSQRVALSVLVALLGARGAAAEPANRTEPYSIRQWDSRDGLPGQQVNQIVQDDAGYLWLATLAGLVRFDGHEFRVFDPGNSDLPSSRITALHRGRDGTLWLGTLQGHAIGFADGRFTVYGMLPNMVESIVEGRAGEVWLAMQGDLNVPGMDPLWTLREGRLAPFAEARAIWPPLPGVPAAAGERVDGSILVLLSVDPAGNVWGRRAGGEIAGLPDGRRPVVADAYADGGASLQGPLFVRRRAGASEVLDARGAVRGAWPGSTASVPWFVSRRGELWVSERNVIAAYRRGSLEAVFRTAIDSDVLCMFEDPRGNLWIGSRTSGFYRISPNPFLTLWPDRVMPEIVGVGANGDAIFGVANEPYSPVSMIAGFEKRQIPGVYGFVLDDRRGTRWNLTLEGVVGHRPGRPEMLLPFLAHRAFLDRSADGVLWFLGDALYRVDPYADPEPIVERFAVDVQQALLQQKDGVVWVAGTLGLHRIEGNSLRTFTTADGLPVDHTRSLHEDAEGVLWIGTYLGGIVRHANGEFRTVRQRDGLAEDVVSAILEDEAGNFWMAGNRGIHRARHDDLNAFLDGTIDRVPSASYGREVTPNPEATGRSSLRDGTGRMWVPTFGGLVTFVPGEVLALEQSVPRVHVQGVAVADRVFVADAPVEIEPGPRRMTVTYVGIDLRNPEALRYRYRLEGLDRAWVEAGPDRQAVYAHVPPGRYTFRAQAAGPGSRFGDAEATLGVTVAPFFHETRLFLGLIVLLVAGTVFAAVRWRILSLRRQAETLEAQVAARTRDLTHEKETVQAQAEQLAALDRARSQFFANVSHEFRTPLTLIQGPLEDVQAGLHGPLPAALAPQVDTAVGNARRLLRLVEQLLDVARADAGKLDIQACEVDLPGFVRRVAEGFGPALARRGVALDLALPSEPLGVWFDAEQMEKVLVNLLGNAMKFAPGGGRVRVEAGADGESAWIAVTDDGPGIPAEHLPRVFERYYQVEGSSPRHLPGMGIGLALAREIVILHHGTIAAESPPEGGSRFVVHLPRGDGHLADEQRADDPPQRIAAPSADEVLAEPLPVPQPGGAPPGDEAATVLVVDDHPEVRAYVRGHLARRYRVFEAGDGESALARAREIVPDLVVSDVMMPGLDGFGLCRALKGDPETDFIPVILLTARASSDSRIEGFEGGADDYLTKPFRVRELEARVDNLIRSRRKLLARLAPSPPDPSAAVPPDVTTEDAVFLERVRGVIEESLGDERFGVDELAEAVGHSRATLYRRVQSLLDETPMELIWSLRLDRAAQLLAAGAGSVSEVAYAVGFASVSHFSRRFRGRHGEPPSRWRERPAPPAGPVGGARSGD